MSGWQLTKGLTRFRTLVNARWPDRDHVSDGTIGNEAHQERTSGHNPDDTPGSKPAWDGDPDSTSEVRAFDMDSDLREPGTTAQMLIDHLRKLPGLGDVIRYMIHAGYWYHSRDGFTRQPFDGDPHPTHVHFEGAWTQAADNNTTFDYRLDEVGDMAFDKDDLGVLVHTDNVIKSPPGASPNSDGTPNTHWTMETYLASTYLTATQARQYALDAKAAVAALDAKVTAIAAGVAAENAEKVPTAGQVADAVVAALPPGPLTAEQARDAVLGALREAFGGES